MAEFLGGKWGNATFGTTGGVVTWSVTPGGLPGVRTTFFTQKSDKTVDPNAALDFDYIAELRDAFSLWSDVADIEFVQVRDGGARIGQGPVADIRVSFAQLDGVGGTGGRTASPGKLAKSGDMLFDVADFGGVSADRFPTIALHEIGHSIGLQHEDAVDALMNSNPGFDPVLRADDIFGAQHIYGREDDTPDVIRMKPGQKVLNIQWSSEPVVLQGNGGANRIDGGVSDDIIRGGGGNDLLIGRAGDDKILGAGGRDRAFGGTGDDRLGGGAGNDVLGGGGGADRVNGGAGNDRAFGGGGADLINGGAGDDRMAGGGDADVMIGGAGDDTMSGGAGADRFVFQTGSGVDRINGFASGADVIDLRRYKDIDAFEDVELTADASVSGARIALSNGDSILLANVAPEELDATDFLF